MEKRVLIRRPVEEVFEYVTDYNNSCFYLGPSFYLQAAGPGPYGIGTPVVAAFNYLGVNIKLLYIVQEFQPNKKLRLVAQGQNVNGITIDSEVVWRFKAEGLAATQVSFALEITPRYQVFARMTSLIVEPVINAVRSSVSLMLSGSMLRLKQTLEMVPSESVNLREVQSANKD
ncbi:MAG TPA: hypothetical protein VH186_37635 [Chloroflexia bacterium]|nr:hypothetical protein [Chloroflexia bacterium]